MLFSKVTVVRLHRIGEGASYTGLKYETDHGPALAAAADALETGNLDAVYALIDEVTKDGIRVRYRNVILARENAHREGTVAADRERAEAELIFEKYVYGLYQSTQGLAGDAEGGGGHDHGAQAEDDHAAPADEHDHGGQALP